MVNPLTCELTFKKRPFIGERIIDQVLILLTQHNGKRWLFNESGIEIWHLLESCFTFDDLIRAVADNNQCPVEECLEPIEEFLETLHNCGLIEFYRNGQEVPCTPYPQDMLRQYSSFFQQKDIIQSILLEITYQCNIRCRHCYLDHYNGSLSIDAIHQLLLDLRDFGTTDVAITGGEIFTRHDIFDIFQMSIDLGFVMSFITNGTLLTEEKLARLQGMPFKTIKVSLYAMEPQLHDHITGLVGSFAKTTFAIERLVSMGKNVVVNTIVQKDTVHQVRQIQEYAASLGCGFECDHKILPRRSGNPEPMQYFVSEEDLVTLFKADLITPPKEIVCGAGASRARVNPLGEVLICEFIHTPVGNIHQQSITELWHSFARQNLRERLSNYYPLECQACELKSSCTRCPAFIWHSGKEPIHHHELMCRMTRSYNASKNRGHSTENYSK